MKYSPEGVLLGTVQNSTPDGAMIAAGVTAGPSGVVYVCGYTTGTVPGQSKSGPSGDADAFVQRWEFG